MTKTKSYSERARTAKLGVCSRQLELALLAALPVAEASGGSMVALSRPDPAKAFALRAGDGRLAISRAIQGVAGGSFPSEAAVSIAPLLGTVRRLRADGVQTIRFEVVMPAGVDAPSEVRLLGRDGGATALPCAIPAVTLFDRRDAALVALDAIDATVNPPFLASALARTLKANDAIEVEERRGRVRIALDGEALGVAALAGPAAFFEAFPVERLQAPLARPWLVIPEALGSALAASLACARPDRFRAIFRRRDGDAPGGRAESLELSANMTTSWTVASSASEGTPDADPIRDFIDSARAGWSGRVQRRHLIDAVERAAIAARRGLGPAPVELTLADLENLAFLAVGDSGARFEGRIPILANSLTRSPDASAVRVASGRLQAALEFLSGSEASVLSVRLPRANGGPLSLVSGGGPYGIQSAAIVSGEKSPWNL